MRSARQQSATVNIAVDESEIAPNGLTVDGDHAKIVAVTLKPPPKKYGVMHSSSRLLGQHLRISNATIAKAWRDYGVAP